LHYVYICLGHAQTAPKLQKKAPDALKSFDAEMKPPPRPAGGREDVPEQERGLNSSVEPST
jgi:hypothetical protein